MLQEWHWAKVMHIILPLVQTGALMEESYLTFITIHIKGQNNEQLIRVKGLKYNFICRKSLIGFNIENIPVLRQNHSM